jgi:tRNA G18 (ribose-2'-O)-methylase SpoU
VKPITLTDIDDVRLAPFRDLNRRTGAASTDRFVVEGRHLVKRLLNSDFTVESIVCSGRMAAEFTALALEQSVPLLIAADDLIHTLVGFEFHRGVLACGLRPQPASMPITTGTIIICPNVRDAENLGSIMRTSRALGVSGLVVGSGAADPYSRRAVRVSMGTAFDLPISIVDEFLPTVVELKRIGFKVFATMLSEQSVALQDINDVPHNLAIVLGSEADGLDETWSEMADVQVVVPMSAGVDSLNVGVAAGIVIHRLMELSGKR